MVTSFQVNVVVHCKEVIHYLLVHAGTAEPLRVSPPEAVAYSLEVMEIFDNCSIAATNLT